MESQIRPNAVEYLLTPPRSPSNETQFITAALEVEERMEEAEGHGRAPQETKWDKVLNDLNLSNKRKTK